MEARITIRFGSPDKAGRLRAKRWCGDHEDIPLTSDMMESLRGVYLPPLRDASQGLRPGRTSQLSRLFQMLADDPGKLGINEALKKLDDELRKHPPVVSTHNAISARHGAMLGEQLAQSLELGLSGTDYQRLASRLSLAVDQFEIEQNGLGFNNLIFMAVVLSELTTNPQASYRGLIIEEPEAHLHPQLQVLLLGHFDAIKAAEGERPVQLFVTTHSPNLASVASLDSLVCVVDNGASVETFFPRDVAFARGKREKLERYLDVTRAELFFARRAVLVEGAAELMLVNVLAQRHGKQLRHHAVSLISVEGLNFDSFLPLFGENGLKIPLAVLTDADPGIEQEDLRAEEADGGAPVQHGVPIAADPAQQADAEERDVDIKTLYPSPGDAVQVSANTAKMKQFEDRFIRVFHGLKTLEYDLALFEQNRSAMLKALKELRPRVALRLEQEVALAEGDANKARVLFSGMFERKYGNVPKGQFGQTLAHLLAAGEPFVVPNYIKAAIDHVCQVPPNGEQHQ
ncbi:AAA family ATPase [Stenotrophomonas sp. CD2]|nr:AAA family ATPase [Stenotrophomonas sp. CD2]